MISETADMVEPAVQQYPHIFESRADLVEFRNLLEKSLITSAGDRPATSPAPVYGAGMDTISALLEKGESASKEGAANPGISKTAINNNDTCSNTSPFVPSSPRRACDFQGMSDYLVPPPPEGESKGEGGRSLPLLSIPDEAPEKLPGGTDTDHIPADKHHSGGVYTAPGNEMLHVLFPQFESDNQESVEDDIVPADGLKRVNDQTGNELEHAPADSGKKMNVSLPDPGIADNFSGQHPQYSRDNVQQQTGVVGQSLRTYPEAGIRSSFAPEPENTQILIRDSGNVSEIYQPALENNYMLISRYSEQEETEITKVGTLCNATGDNRLLSGEERNKPLVVSEEPITPIPANKLSDSYPGAHITSMFVRRLAVSAGELSPDNWQHGNENRRLPITTEAAPSENVIPYIEKAGGQENAQEVSPLQEPPRISHAEENIQSIFKKGDASIEITLDTDGAGELRIDLILNRGVINAQIQTSDETGKNLIERNLSGLLQSLIHEGLQVGSFSVFLRGKRGGMNDAMRQDDSGIIKMSPLVNTQYHAPANGLVSIFV